MLSLDICTAGHARHPENSYGTQFQWLASDDDEAVPTLAPAKRRV